MDIKEKIAHFERNVEAHARGDNPFDPWELADLLNDMSDRWREVWTMMPRDQVFDNLYGTRANYEVETRTPFLFRRVALDVTSHAIIEWDVNVDGGSWGPVQGPSDILEWLIDHPPYKELSKIAQLYQHAQPMEREASPWVLMMALIGNRRIGYTAPPDSQPATGDTHVCTGCVLLQGLMPIGSEDAVALGKALSTWGEDSEIATAYVHLVDAYDGSIGQYPAFGISD